jgi:hypothetical protein
MFSSLDLHIWVIQHQVRIVPDAVNQGRTPTLYAAGKKIATVIFRPVISGAGKS